MSNRITVGLDGSSAGSAAAGWAAHEAELRGAALELVHAVDRAQYGPFAVPLVDGQDRPPVNADDAGPVVLGVDPRSNCDRHLSFEMADGLETTLRELLSPRERQYPRLAVDGRIVIGQPAIQEAAQTGPVP
ncbi:universal stress protein [Streptomyces sp. NBC_01006]|uniref:universal stress protein n=1 Tax=Streptomyces sp. NBC_01006 TaxID=2903716 RepID=UPI00387095CF|nr:universal stress protein [Streptomyces sp. NBC_01006]